MQAVQNTLRNVAGQLHGLSQTAKLLIGSLMVILVMTLFLVAQYTSRASMESLGLDGSISSDARTRAISYLEQRNIPYRSRGNDILVPVEQKYSVLGQLTSNEIITPEQINFDSLVAQSSPFLSKAQNDRQWLIATMNVVSRTIRHLDGIEHASVVIDEPRNAGGIGRAHLPSSASVTVRTRGQALTQSQVDAIAALVAGSHARLSVENVSVIDSRNNRVHQARGQQALDASNYFELQATKERATREKIMESLSYIPGVNVAVSVIVDTRTITERRRDYENPKLGVTRERSRRTESTTTASASEAGVRPNTGASIGSGGGRASSMSDEQTEAAMIPVFGGSDSQITDPRGHPLQINATIGVPRSYFVNLHQSIHGDQTAQPAQDELDQLIATETERIRDHIEPLIDTRAIDGATAGTVMVSMIPDFAMAMNGSGAGVIHDAGIGGGMVGDGFIRNLALAGLALLSLAMMFLMVRKAGSREELPSAEELVGVPRSLAASEVDVVGEAGETPLSLEGIEVDDADIRRRQMLKQISQMITNSPGDAATIMRRWIKTGA
jgi:flagellar M-ring protein FliF